MLFAKRMALISPEALAYTKLAINRCADAMGFMNAMHAGPDVVAPFYAAKTGVGVQFTEVRKNEGLRVALKWHIATVSLQVKWHRTDTNMGEFCNENAIDCFVHRSCRYRLFLSVTGTVSKRPLETRRRGGVEARYRGL